MDNDEWMKVIFIIDQSFQNLNFFSIIRLKNSCLSRAQFHQHSMCSFYVRKVRAQIFCAYILGLYFTGTGLLAQKLHIERWWNWTQMSISPTFWLKAQMCR